MCLKIHFRLCVIILSVIVMSWADDRRNYADENYLMKLLRKEQKLYGYNMLPPRNEVGWIVRCAGGRGVCVASHACPWERMVSDPLGDCLYGDYAACCYVTPARMPHDIFDVYG